MRDFQWFNVWEQCTTEHLAILDGDASVSVPVSNISDVKPKDTNMNGSEQIKKFLYYKVAYRNAAYDITSLLCLIKVIIAHIAQ